VDANRAGMEDGIAAPCLPSEVLHVRYAQRSCRGQVRGLNKIEVGSLRSRVIEEHLQSQFAHFLLYGQVPLLRVADPVIGIDSVSVADSCWRDEPVLQRQRQSRGVSVFFSRREWRLVRHLRSDRRVRGAVIADAVAGSGDGAAGGSPREAKA